MDLWVVVAGDSQARFVALSLLGLVLGSGSEGMSSVKSELFKRRSDYNLMVKEIGMKPDFWVVAYASDFGFQLKEPRSHVETLVPVTTKGGSVSERSIPRKVKKRKARLRRLASGRRRPRRIQTNPKELPVPYLSS
ncbi:hypothetical protein IGI04_037343 [Brassica rapa subsp. trilocularis]|uniref:Uncharacterized protein n=1 Tax=Brassica rapa subsp. trilocularis TaxID=1813537 RepID=A0ABQ7LJZ8_BRACM|nr:hypothetical protein IGI04_037343 [Brassica rapa subsp. trilocularis]